MALARRFRMLGAALRYRGREGMWTWILHRATGLGILLFLLVHVVDTATVIYWPDFYDRSLELYRHPLFTVAEWLIFFSVLYHGVNGLRIIVQDFSPAVMAYRRQLAWAVGGVTAVAMIPVTWMMLAPLAGLAEKPGTERARRLGIERTAAEAPAAAPAPAPSVGAAPAAVIAPAPEAAR